jgi:colanic acid/amylovoran biosynthesis glycosyltransferase
MNTKKVTKVAFIVPEFPAVSLTFITNQIADLSDRGIDVHVFALRKGNEAHVSERYFSYNMAAKISYLTAPENKLERTVKAMGIILKYFFIAPGTILRACNLHRYGSTSRSLYTLFWAAPFIGKKFDVVHCHFGTVATKYLIIRDILQDTTPLVTTFYGYDVSHTPKVKGMDCYRDLIAVCDRFLVMSENMKKRVLPLGVPEEHVEVHPISIDVDSYAYRERAFPEGEKVRITSVGRFVEKKGFDDLLRGIAYLKDHTQIPFVCSVVGDGELHDEIHALAKDLDIQDVLEFKGFMKLEDVLSLYEKSHLYVQASKTAKDGDME